MAGHAEALLSALTANEEESVRTVLALRPHLTGEAAGVDAALTPRTRNLVRLAALIAMDAPTTSLRWAVELACSAGADEDEIVRVLATVGADIGLPRIVSAAPRLAAAIGYDVDLEGWDADLEGWDDA
jgi:4-carboxymuconolactone decarboxylase